MGQQVMLGSVQRKHAGCVFNVAAGLGSCGLCSQGVGCPMWEVGISNLLGPGLRGLGLR